MLLRSTISVFIHFHNKIIWFIAFVLCFAHNLEAQLKSHPGYDIVDVTVSGFNKGITGLDFLPDGRMVVLTYRGNMDKPSVQGNDLPLTRTEWGEAYIIDNIGGSGSATATKIFDKFIDAMGVLVHNGNIIVADQNKLLKLVDNGSGSYEAETLADIPTGDGWFEYSFGPVAPGDGYFYVGNSNHTEPPIGYLTEQGAPDRGTIIRIPEEGGDYEVYATGIRMPDGMGIGPNNQLIVTENQGIWRPASTLEHIQQGKFYGYAHDEADRNPDDVTPPSIWLPYQTFVNSPTQPVYMKSGRYKGQMLFGDWGKSGLFRAFLDPIKDKNGEDTYQGACFFVTDGFKQYALRLHLDPNTGEIYTGNIGMAATGPGPQKVIPNDDVSVFEMLAIRARNGGMEIEFTEPVGDMASQTNMYSLEHWYYEFNIEYYNDPMGITDLDISGVQISEDKTKVFLEISNLTTDRVIHFELSGNLKSQNGGSLLYNEAWYTLNYMNQSEPFTSVNPNHRVIPSDVSINNAAGNIYFEWSLNYNSLSIFNLDGSEIDNFNIRGLTEFKIPKDYQYKGVLLVQLKGNEFSSLKKVAF